MPQAIPESTDPQKDTRAHVTGDVPNASPLRAFGRSLSLSLQSRSICRPPLPRGAGGFLWALHCRWSWAAGDHVCAVRLQPAASGAAQESAAGLPAGAASHPAGPHPRPIHGAPR
ncbi:hypothetical protein EGK76_10750 [Luteimonas sp. 100069]|nr:hypothetical protein EGK76_10750 [Luteimonas sp. 100069]